MFLWFELTKVHLTNRPKAARSLQPLSAALKSVSCPLSLTASDKWAGVSMEQVMCIFPRHLMLFIPLDD